MTSKADDIDDILGFKDGEDSIVEVQKDTSVSNAISNTSEALASDPRLQWESNPISSSVMVLNKDLPKLMGDLRNVDPEYIDVVNRLLNQYGLLPNLKYDELYAELAELSVKSCPTPTLQVLNVELEKVQGSKDRLSEIFIDVLKNHTFKKRAVDILRDSWAKFSNEKSADKRKGEGSFVVSDFESDFASTEALLKSCVHVLKNLDSLTDNLSRRITVIQLQLKLFDMGRSALPDFNFDKTPSMFEEITEGKTNEAGKEEG